MDRSPNTSQRNGGQEEQKNKNARGKRERRPRAWLGARGSVPFLESGIVASTGSLVDPAILASLSLLLVLLAGALGLGEVQVENSA